MIPDHGYDSCSDTDRYNAGYNLCRRCTELSLEVLGQLRRDLARQPELLSRATEAVLERYPGRRGPE